MTRKVFVGGPFSAAMEIVDGRVTFDSDLKERILAAHQAVRDTGSELMAAHIADAFGEKFDTATFVPRDNRWAKECDVYVALLPLNRDGSPYRTDGTFVELGLALAYQKRVLVVIQDRNHTEHSYYVRQLETAGGVQLIDWDEFFSDPRKHLGEGVGILSTREHTTDVDHVVARLAARESIEHVSVGEITLAVFPEVLSPRLSHAPDYLMRDWVIPTGCRVLDLGCGTGVLGLSALARGAAELVALDINPRAIENAQLNIERLGFVDRARALHSDGYGALRNDEKFDVLLLSPPYWNRPASTELERFCFDSGYRFLEAAVRGASHHLAPNGHMFIIFSDQGDVTHLVRLVQDAGLSINRLLLHRPSSEGGHIRIFLDLTHGPGEITR